MKSAALALLAACGGHASGSFSLEVTDGVGGPPIGARVLLFRGDAPLHLGTLDLYNQRQGSGACAWQPGVIGTWDGIVLAKGTGTIPIGTQCAIPPGHYKAWAWRGIEYNLWQGELDVAANAKLSIPITRAWKTAALAADLHVHAHDSNDSTMPDEQRVAAQAAAGIFAIALSNHNVMPARLTAAISQLGLTDQIVEIPAVEITSEAMHVNAFGVAEVPPADQIVNAEPKALLAMLRAMPANPVIQINHPRFRYQSLFDTSHWNGVTWPPPFPTDFDAIEIVPGYSANNAPGDRRLDDMLRDFYTFYEHGQKPAPTGGSDTHDFNWVLDGTARTYLFDADPHHLTDAIRDRHTEATTGPFLVVDVNGVGPGGVITNPPAQVHYKITVAQADFVKATTLTIQLGTHQTVLAVKPSATTTLEGDLPIDDATFFGVSVEGEEPLPLPLTGTYQQDKWKKAGITPFAVISPIRFVR